MSPKEHVNPEDGPQTPDEIDEVPGDDVTGAQNHEQDEENDGAETKSMTMDERQAKLRQLRAKMVCRVSSPSQPLFQFLTAVTAVVCTREPCLCDRRILEVQKYRPRSRAAREAA